MAFYAVAFFIGNAIKVPGRSVASISTPLISKAWEKRDINSIRLLYYKSSITQLIIGGVFFLCIWLNIDQVFDLLPEKFQGGKWVVLFISLSQLFNMVSGLNGSIIVNTKYFKYDLITNIFLVILTIVLNYVFIKVLNLGINGAAMATALSIFCYNFIKLLIIKVKMDLQPFSIKTLYTLILLYIVFFIVNLFPVLDIPLLSIIFRSILIFLFFIPFMIRLELSEDINNIIYNLINKFFRG